MKQIIDGVWNMPAKQIIFNLGGAVIVIGVIWLAFVAWIIYKNRF